MGVNGVGGGGLKRRPAGATEVSPRNYYFLNAAAKLMICWCGRNVGNFRYVRDGGNGLRFGV